jgi:membrane protein DedA with SNARE-associated domain
VTVLAAVLSGLVDRYGYAGIAATVFVEGFGLPAPGETAVVAGAAYAARGHLNVVVVAVAAVLAAAAGDNVGYLIGRVGGRRLLLRYGRYVRLTPERLDRLDAFMTRHGRTVVALARFVEGLRQFNGLVAGASGMEWRRFLVFNVIGAVAWVGVWATAGYVAGNELGTLRRYEPYVIGVAVLALAGYLLLHGRRRARRDP